MHSTVFSFLTVFSGVFEILSNIYDRRCIIDHRRSICPKAPLLTNHLFVEGVAMELLHQFQGNENGEIFYDLNLNGFANNSYHKFRPQIFYR